MTLQQFWDELDKHDWYHKFSDDPRVYNNGHCNLKNIQVIANESKEKKELYNNFRNHHFSGKAWETDKQPKPERPLDG